MFDVWAANSCMCLVKERDCWRIKALQTIMMGSEVCFSLAGHSVHIKRTLHRTPSFLTSLDDDLDPARVPWLSLLSWPLLTVFGMPRQQFSSSSGSSESSTLTSPVSRSASVNSSVYTQLYKPDLIKLSSPAQRQTRLRREEEGSRWSPSINQTNRDDFTKNWVENNEHRYQKWQSYIHIL